MSSEPRGRLLMPWFDDDVGEVWLEVAPEQWTLRSMAMHEVGRVGVTTLGPDTTYIYAGSDSLDSCDDAWGEAPAEFISEREGQYIYDTHVFRPPPNIAHRIDPSARCVAYPQAAAFQNSAWGSQWALHDLEGNEFHLLPEWGAGRFHWFDE